MKAIEGSNLRSLPATRNRSFYCTAWNHRNVFVKNPMMAVFPFLYCKEGCESSLQVSFYNQVGERRCMLKILSVLIIQLNADRQFIISIISEHKLERWWVIGKSFFVCVCAAIEFITVAPCTVNSHFFRSEARSQYKMFYCLWKDTIIVCYKSMALLNGWKSLRRVISRNSRVGKWEKKIPRACELYAILIQCKEQTQ